MVMIEMIDVYSDNNKKRKDLSIACIGYFDGIHKGHAALIHKVKELCHQEVPSIICFDNDPWIIMNKIKDAQYITPFSARMELLYQMGIQRCFLLHFDESMMHLSSNDFIHQVLEPLNLKGLVCGDDFHFGFCGKGTIHDLSKATFPLHVIPKLCNDGKKISSTHIEQLLRNGNTRKAYQELGRYYAIKGTVVHGSHVGGPLLGFPTANMIPKENYIIPKHGVYSGAIKYRNRLYKAMINVGHNPTMNFQENTSLEAYILDFDQTIYGEEIVFYFYDYLRDEKKFSNIAELKEQLKTDVQHVRYQK